MATSLRLSDSNKASLSMQLLLLFIGYHFSFGTTSWLLALGLMAAMSLGAWYSALRIFRTTTGTPTSRIGSAAQGYVELQGQGRINRTGPLIGKLSGLPCLWYRYTVEKYNGDTWKIIEEGESSEPILLSDGTGVCLIDPAGAEVLTGHQQNWSDASLQQSQLMAATPFVNETRGADTLWRAERGLRKSTLHERRYTEWRLIDLDNIYALGEFKTVGGSTTDRTLNDEMKLVLEEWKDDMPELQRRFDLDGNGALDMQEWQLARSAARREAETNLNRARSAPDINYLVRPQDKRLFLISNLDQKKLETNYLRWAWVHLINFFGVLSGAVWLLNQYP